MAPSNQSGPGDPGPRRAPARGAALLLLLLLLVAGCQFAQTPAKQPVATVGGQAIYEDELLTSVQAQMRQLRNQEFEIKSRALDSLIDQKLVEAEAKKKGISAEKLLAQEVEAKAGEVTDAEVEAYYLGQKDRINRPLEEVRSQIKNGLKQAKLQQVRQDFVKGLREKAQVTVLLTPLKVQVGIDPKRMRGNPDAPVTIVEFSDYQCPFCQRAQSTIREVLAKYQGKVRHAYRDFPLQQIHPQAESAAEAARCAAEQGKFWEYHTLLFTNREKLDGASLKEHAKAAKLDEKGFADCVASGKYKAKIEQDQHEGEAAGVTGTPAFFINGVFLGGAYPAAAFEKIIDAELAAAKRPNRQ